MEEMKNNGQEGMKGRKCEKCEMCGRTCMYGCGCGWMRGHRAFRIVLGVVIALIVFWIGVKVGEVRVALQLHSNGGYRGGYSNTYYQGGQMMGGSGVVVPVNERVTSSTPAQQ